jgi:hypothetical protein
MAEDSLTRDERGCRQGAGKKKRAGIFLRVYEWAEDELPRIFYAQPLTAHTNL